eukprot:g7150.t1
MSTWRKRIAAGAVLCNGQRVDPDFMLAVNHRLQWTRPPWMEEAVPSFFEVLLDDGDMIVLSKPSGLPVLPGGGFVMHTLLKMLEQRYQTDTRGVPKPVHRLGRFTSGLLVAARSGPARNWLSAILRDSTRALSNEEEANAVGCRKLYRALVVPSVLTLAVGESLTVSTPIMRRPHPLLGTVWSAGNKQEGGLPSRSVLTLLERRADGDLLEVAIASGRPHQIRIHCASIGAPLLGDPLYMSGGIAREDSLPGDGGYSLHSHRLRLQQVNGSWVDLQAPPPQRLLTQTEQRRKKEKKDKIDINRQVNR